MAQAPRDGNFVPTALFEIDGTTGEVMAGQIDQATGRILVDATGAGSGTVTSVSVVSANGFAGTVATATTTPAITLTTSINSPVLAGNGTAISGATTTGSGSTVVLATAPTLPTTVTIGAAAGTTGSIAFKGTTSGTVTLSVADAAGTWTMKLPTTDGGAGEFLQTDGAGNTTWAAVSAAAGGGDTQVQYNNAGALGGITGATSDGTTLTITSGRATTDFSPSSNDGAALGTTALGFADLHLATGGVINWANGEVTITETDANTLTIAGGTLAVSGAITGTSSVTLGAAAGTTGSLVLKGTTSGTVTFSVADAAGTWTMKLPANDGDANQFLQTDGSGNTTWATQAVPTTITVANEAVDTSCYLGFFTAATGDLGPKTNANLTFDSSTGIATFGQTITGSITGNAGTVTVADEATDATCFIGFYTAASGSLAGKTNTNMTFDSSTGIATFASTVLTTTDINGGTVDGVTIGGASAGAITGTTITANTGLMPDANDGAYIGQAGTAFADLFLASGGVINWDSGNATLTHSASLLTSNVALSVGTSNAITCGTVELGHASDTTLARVSAGVVSIEGVNIVTTSSTDTLSNKTLTAPKFADAGFIADANGNESLVFQTTASAVNEFEMTNAATGNAPILAVTGGDTNIDLKLTPKGSGKVVPTAPVNHGAYTAYFTETDNGNSGTADTIDWTLSNKQKSTLTGNCTFTFTAPPGPCSLILKLVQDGTGSRTVTWPAAVHWSGGTAPTLTTTASKVDIISLYFDGSTYFATSSLNYTA